jgi:glyoxylase I family protein
MILGIEHLGLAAKDPEQLALWYERVLDFRIVYKTEGPNPAFFIAGAKSGIIEIIPYPNEMEVPSEKDKRLHLAIEVDNFEQAVARLNAQGVELAGEPVDIPYGGKIVFFNDPEGNWLHFVYRPQKPWTL